MQETFFRCISLLEVWLRIISHWYFWVGMGRLDYFPRRFDRTHLDCVSSINFLSLRCLKLWILNTDIWSRILIEIRWLLGINEPWFIVGLAFLFARQIHLFRVLSLKRIQWPSICLCTLAESIISAYGFYYCFPSWTKWWLGRLRFLGTNVKIILIISRRHCRLLALAIYWLCCGIY